MTKPVFVTESAAADIEEDVRWWARERSLDQALRWLPKFVKFCKHSAAEPNDTPDSTKVCFLYETCASSFLEPVDT